MNNPFINQDSNTTTDRANLVIESFKDLEQVEQYDKNCKILRIQYTPSENIINNFFRAALTSNEISERVYFLSQLVIDLSASNYMAWYIRRKCIDDLDLDILKELQWVDSITEQHQKNYQIWHHRKFLTEKILNYSNEIAITNKVFETEPKNYHAWCHRIWVTRRFELYNDEIEFSKKMIIKDPRNNSAWNYRYFCMSYLDGLKDNNQINDKNIDINIKCADELDFCFSMLKGDENNESIYSYLRGIFELLGVKINKCKELQQKLESTEKQNYHALSLLLDIHIENITEQLNQNQSKESNTIAIQKINGLFDDLEEQDYIRIKYWKWRRKNLKDVVSIN